MDIQENFNSSWSYKFKRLLDSGGSADVLLYTRQMEGLADQEVVLKVLRISKTATAELFNEGKRLSELKHPNILTTFGYEKIGVSRFALVLEYIKGKNLRSIESRIKSFDRADIASYVIKMALEALNAAHSQKVIHGDVSSRNILISETGSIKLSDFGESRRVDGDGTLSSKKGSVDYLAPERWEGSPSSKAADIFALGVLAYELLSGENPLRITERKMGRERTLKFLENKPWLRFNLWEDFFLKTLEINPDLRQAPHELLGLIPKSAFGRQKLKNYLGGPDLASKFGVFNTATLTLSKKAFRFWRIPLLKPLIMLVLLINSVAIGVDHGLYQKRMKSSSLTLTSAPWGEVFIDGSSIGYTPLLNYNLGGREGGGSHKILWQDASGTKVEKTLMDYGNGLFAYQILKTSRGAILVSPLMSKSLKVGP